MLSPTDWNEFIQAEAAGDGSSKDEPDTLFLKPEELGEEGGQGENILTQLGSAAEPVVWGQR